MPNITDKGQKKRDEILAVADRLFRNLGYEKATLRMIADETGISIGHLVHYFDKKEKVLFALLDDLYERIVTNASSMTKGQDPLKIYAFSHTWFFLTASALPDLNRLLIECMKSHGIQKYFIKRSAAYLIRLFEARGLERDEARITRAIIAAQSAHFGLLAEAGPETKSADIVELSRIHTDILFHLLGVRKSVVAEIQGFVVAELEKHSVADMVTPFTRDYTWYEIEKHELRLGETEA